MRTSTRLAVVSILALGSLALLTGCEEEESNDLAKAQQCLDEVDSSAAGYQAAAEACMQHISDYDSQQANIIKCSIKFMSGGLTTQKIANAYKELAKDVPGVNQEMVYITTLALTPVNKATEAQFYCERTGLKGFIYLANLAVVGSNMAAVLPTMDFDPADPAQVPDAGDIAAILNDCKPPANCGGAHAAIGESIVTLSESYCTGDNADQNVCGEINQAIVGAGGDTTLISKQLFCLLDGKTYDSMSDACVP